MFLFYLETLSFKNYQQTIDWLFLNLPMYQRDGPPVLKLNLDSITFIANHFGNPQNNFKSIHIAGTNGKGSSANMIASVLKESNYKVGLYTSPHLIDFRERIKINGKKISKFYVIKFVNENFLFLKKNKFSFFEITFALAISFFSQKEVDYAVIETGLGGRLDATNIIKPIVSLITNVGLDHQQFLGDSYEQIAYEKAGIIKKNTPIVISEFNKKTYPVFEKIAEKNFAKLFLAKKSNFTTDLDGDYQSLNIDGVVKTIEIIDKEIINNGKLKKGLLNVKKNMGFQGRWDVLGNNPLVIADAAHNFNAILSVLNQLKKNSKKVHFIFGLSNDKKIENFTKILPSEFNYYLCSANVPRSMNIDELDKVFYKKKYLKYECHKSVKNACLSALKKSEKNDIIFICGSIFIVGEVLKHKIF